MRFLIGCILVVYLGPFARADEPAYKERLSSYVSGNSWVFPPELTARSMELTIELLIDRNGRFLDAKIVKGDLPSNDASNVLTALRRLQPVPRVPDDMQAPFKFTAIFVFIPPSDTGRARLSWMTDSSNAAADEAYRKSLQSRIDGAPVTLSPEMKSWPREVRLQIAMTIEQDGTLAAVEIIKGTGSESIDDTIVTRLKTIQPLPAVPRDVITPLRLNATLTIVRPLDPDSRSRPGSEVDEARMKRSLTGVCRGC